MSLKAPCWTWGESTWWSTLFDHHEIYGAKSPKAKEINRGVAESIYTNHYCSYLSLVFWGCFFLNFVLFSVSVVPKIASIIEYFPSTSISLKFYYGDNPCSIVRPINLYLCICKIRNVNKGLSWFFLNQLKKVALLRLCSHWGLKVLQWFWPFFCRVVCSSGKTKSPKQPNTKHVHQIF